MLEKYLKEIQKRAYELFEKRGGTHGAALEDWVQAEKEILSKAKKTVKSISKKIKK